MSSASRKFGREQQARHTRQHKQRTSRPPQPQPTITLTPEQDALLEQTMEADRAYFRNHPSATSYVRSFREGENAGVEMEAGKVYMVRVTKLAEGIRNREFIEMPEMEKQAA